ncbi:MAG: hypothetical protein NTX50_08895 [Candidatus Sumerlaeota bacterium]|nr:hypothetical protein [Candidatus Sumerlaeota bacterium]
MNSRERYLETILFGHPDKIPFQPGGPRESTLKAWHSQGLPEGRNWLEALRDELHLNGDPCLQHGYGAGVSFEMNPWFEEKVIERKERSLIVQDWKGNVCEISNEFDVTYLRYPKDFVTRRWIKLPVVTRADWEAMKQRYNPLEPARYPEDFEQRCRDLRARDGVLTVSVNGPFWQAREWVGAEQICELLLTDPDWVREMMAFWSDFVTAVLAEILKRVDIDVLSFSEDMAYKGMSFISPAMARDFLAPIWQRWNDQARAGGAKIFDMDSDGYIGDLIPVWLEAGFNCCNPIEVAAGCDVVEFRRRFGRTMAYHGAVDKRLMARGGERLTRELNRIIPPLIAEGGFIPSCDHGVPADVSWPNFLEYARQLAKLTGWL